MQVPVNPVASPLNYTGGKYKLLPQILPLFPNDVRTFVDLFCGGCNVAVNVTAQKIICNDSEAHLVGLLEKMKSDGAEKFSQEIDSIIQTYNLSDTTKHKYDFYGCDSSAGLGKYNREHFLRLREHFNSIQNADWAYYYELFALIAYAFNNQIRFNSNGCYNLPVGKRDFNSRMRKKVKDFSAVLQEKKIEFSNQNFERFDFSELTSADFLYADPPYLITRASYNEKNGWNEELEEKLLSLLDSLSARNIKFALSNVLSTDGKENSILKGWLSAHGNYACHHLDFSYRNSSYHKKTATGADEVLVTNY